MVGRRLSVVGCRLSVVGCRLSVGKTDAGCRLRVAREGRLGAAVRVGPPTLAATDCRG